MTNPTDDTTTSIPATSDATAVPARRRLLLPIALGVGALLTAGAITVGGFAVAAELADDDDDDRAPAASTSPQTTQSGDATSGRDDRVTDIDDRVTDQEFAAVSAAALAAAGAGTVTEIDRSDDPGEAWEVEVFLENGDEVDVELADDYRVLRIDLDPRN